MWHIDLLACPDCKKTLQIKREKLVCSSCHKGYHYQKNNNIIKIVDFLKEDDETNVTG